MVNIRPALETCETDEEKLIGYQKIRCHMMFNIKLGDSFRTKGSACDRWTHN